MQKISYGETRSYSDIAIAINKPSAFRAVATANGANQLAIIIPCHRVINISGDLGGYGGGLTRKEWLHNLERIGITQRFEKANKFFKKSSIHFMNS